ncbi:MAG: HEPN domain-containing protein [Candidatus Gastranaerophilales bacterium]|nr:HEPN domain-containing protein [Candidatus Gastranaerophilales bacterium]
MMQHKKILIKNSIEKADEALVDAQNNINLSLRLVQNRIYYAVFYIVLALSYLDGFATGKHHQLMGWFNREYIYKNKIFDVKLKSIYRTLLSNREKFDYNVSKNPEKDKVEKDFEDAKFFVETVKNHILKRIPL